MADKLGADMTAMFAPLLESTMFLARGGAAAHVRANTIDSFQLGLRLGASGINGDIWLTGDGQAVFNTGSQVGPRLRRKSINSIDKAASPSELVGLGELYEGCGSDFELALEMRDPAAFEAVIEAAQAAGALERLWVTHGDIETLSEWRESYPGVRFVHSVRLADLPRGPEQHAARLRERGISGVSLPFSEWTAGYVTLFHRFTRLTMGWMAEHERQVVELLDMGIDVVVSEQVERMTDAARSRGY
ncbi:MAG TPA: hypothetical protein VL068_01455 [Microthrixaceae bacterium]|nr:hypothetical protein [Microthrixaceae bacterium]